MFNIELLRRSKAGPCYTAPAVTTTVRRTARTVLSGAVLVGAGWLARRPVLECRGCGHRNRRRCTHTRPTTRKANP